MFHNRKWWWWVLWVESLVMTIGVFFVIIFSSTVILPDGWAYVSPFYWLYIVLGVAEVLTLLFGRGGPGSSTALMMIGIGRIFKIIYPSVLLNILFYLDNKSIDFSDNLNGLYSIISAVEPIFGIALIVLAIVWHKFQQPKKV
jgi:hypothetical protein